MFAGYVQFYDTYKRVRHNIKRRNMGKLISLAFLFILSNWSILAQSEQLNIDSLKRFQKENRQLAQYRKIKLEEAIEKIKSSELSDEEINRIIHPILVEYRLNNYKELLSKYDSLLLIDQLMMDSIDLQIIEIDSLHQKVNQGILAKSQIDSLKQSTERLKSIMNNYLAEIELLKSNSIASIDSADLYYYNIKDLKKPKIYLYKCPQDQKRSQYWKVSSNLKNKTLVTEAFNMDFIQFERFEEKYDSLGSKLIDYIMINDGSVKTTIAEENNVYLWKSSKEYAYQVKYNSPNGIIQFTKTRKFLRKDSLLILGGMKEVLVFKGDYLFYNTSNKETFSYSQYSYYAKDIGFVKYERTIPTDNYDYEYVNLELEAVFSKKEWKKLKRNVSKTGSRSMP